MLLLVDFVHNSNVEEVKSVLCQHRDKFAKQKVINSFPPQFGLVKRFWRYLLEHEVERPFHWNMLWFVESYRYVFGDFNLLLQDIYIWGSFVGFDIQQLNNSYCSCLKHCSFCVIGKGQFKDEFVTAGGVPLTEISLNTMQSRIQQHLFFAGEVLNIDGVTGGFNFQNALSGGYVAGTSIGNLATANMGALIE
ncbi:uncharacterized protein [Primulina eburnea]|uniref:uncharacterized protein isoform X2 n=1 Tax=Primulina eburnea TaxID=1245227 RepID=UPI003C6C1D84